MSITNLPKQYKQTWVLWLTPWVNNTSRTWKELSTGNFVNTAKASIGETWGSIQTSWATETRTWQRVSQLFTNVALGPTGALWSVRRFPWTETAPWLTDAGITNVAKP